MATPAAAIARMPLRRSDPVRSRTLPPAGGNDLLRQRLLAGAADHPDVEPALDQQPCGAGVIGPALGGADRAGRQRHRGAGAEVVGLPPARDFLRRHDELRHRPFRRQRRAGRQRQRGILVDEAGQGLLAPAHPVDQPESGLAEKAHALGDTGQRRRNRGLPGAGQDEGGSIAPGAQFGCETPLLGQRKPAAGQVPDDPGADARHVIDQRRAQGGHQQVDRAVRPALLQDPHHRMAADEIADPHIGNDQDRPRVGGILHLDLI